MPIFLLNLVNGVNDHKKELDRTISEHLKTGWSLERLTVTDKTLLRLGLFEIKYFNETPDRVALNEIIEVAKNILMKRLPNLLMACLASLFQKLLQQVTKDKSDQS